MILKRVGPRPISRALVVLLALFATNVSALPRGTVTLGSGESFQTASGGKTVTCAVVSATWKAGKYLNGNVTLFLAHVQARKNLKLSLRKTSDSAKAARIRKKIAAITKRIKAEDPVCSAGPGGGGGGGSGSGSFDSLGNVTAAGKALFGIPSNLNASIDAGLTVHNFNSCAGCHGEERNRTFSAYRTIIAGPEMGFSVNDINDQQLADLTAYLNRFR